MTVLAACQQAATPAPTTAPAPPAAAATTAPAAAGPTTAPAAVSSAKINGKFTVVQSRDFHPDHNALIEAKIREYAAQQNWELDHSYIDANAGTSGIVQKLTASVQAGDPADLVIYELGSAQLHFLDIVEDVSNVEAEIEKMHGKPSAGYVTNHHLEDKWWAVPHFSRTNGTWVRMSVFKAAGIDPLTDLDTFEKMRDAALRVSQPDKEMWGWGRTANRSGDGDGTVRDPIFRSGGQINDESGQIVVLNKDPYRQGALLGLNFLKQIYTDPMYASMLPPGVGGWGDPSNNEAWLAGKIAMTANAGTVFAKAIVDKNPVADDTYMIPPPNGLGPGARSLYGAGDSMNFFIMKGAKNRAASEDMIKYLFTPAIYKQMFKISTGYVYPVREWGWDEPEIKESDYAKHVTDVWHKILNDPSGYIGTPYPAQPTPQIGALDTTNFFTDMFGEILAGKSTEDALKTAHDKAVQTFKDFGAKGE
jgi:multiple sugar transport system substrate-binding protein